jgi:hypothetical protein
MKTQFIVTVTQKGENPVKPSYLSRAIRGRMHGGLATQDDEITVRHLVEDDTTPAIPGDHAALSHDQLRDALRAAHQAGQRSGMRVGADSWNAATVYAETEATKLV